jgi:hypothetical protein
MWIYSFDFLFTLGFILLALLSYFVWDRRYRKNQGGDIPKGFERTDEVTIDPSSGRKLRVYYNSRTGERFYHEEE